MKLGQRRLPARSSEAVLHHVGLRALYSLQQHRMRLSGRPSNGACACGANWLRDSAVLLLDETTRRAGIGRLRQEVAANCWQLSATGFLAGAPRAGAVPWRCIDRVAV